MLWNGSVSKAGVGAKPKQVQSIIKKLELHHTWLPHPNNFIPMQCTVHVAIEWYHFGLALCFKSPGICETHTYIYTYMTRAHFLSIVRLWLRAFSAQPPSELCLVLSSKTLLYICIITCIIIFVLLLLLLLLL